MQNLKKIDLVTMETLAQSNHLLLSAPSSVFNNKVPIQTYFAKKVCQYAILIKLIF